MTNHLWESTLFAGFVALLTLALRKNPARVRHWLWLAASIKFLIPFSLLVGVGSHLGWKTEAPSQLTYVMEEASQQLAAPAVHFEARTSSSNAWPMIGGAVWAGGFAVVLIAWCIRWGRVRSALRAASPLRIANVPIAIVSSPGLMEPGAFGILRPVLLLPEGIRERLTAEQLDAIVAHELCHVRRRDNLAAAIHMVVEALFWFHPLVWWIGARLVEERERACDEEVLRMGNVPEVYAEGILKVCRLYLESPLECVSGVTGADLKGRIEGIMTNGVARELDFGRKLLLAVAGFAAIAAPIVVGILNAPPARAQSAPEARMAFEVASVKSNKSEGRPNLEFTPNGRFSARNMPLLILVATAYNVPFQGPRLKGLTVEAANERYDIEATAESGAIPAGASKLAREAKMRLMLQALLEDRFKLKIRREMKDMPVYAVIVGRNGPKLTKSKIEEKDCPDSLADNAIGCHNFRGGMGRGLHAEAINMADLVLAVSNWADRPVVDRTGLEGLFQIETDGWAPMLPRPAGGNDDETKALNDPERPTLYLIFERLGLKMEASKAPVEMFTVEHVEKPSEN